MLEFDIAGVGGRQFLVYLEPALEPHTGGDRVACCIGEEAELVA